MNHLVVSSALTCWEASLGMLVVILFDKLFFVQVGMFPDESQGSVEIQLQNFFQFTSESKVPVLLFLDKLYIIDRFLLNLWFGSFALCLPVIISVTLTLLFLVFAALVTFFPGLVHRFWCVRDERLE